MFQNYRGDSTGVILIGATLCYLWSPHKPEYLGNETLYQKILVRLTQLCICFFPVRKMMSSKQFYNKDDVFKLLI